MMAGLAESLPAAPVLDAIVKIDATSRLPSHPVALLWLSATVMFVLAGAAATCDVRAADVAIRLVVG